MADGIYRTKLYEDVANRILEKIRGGEWPEDARLPAEMKLAAQFDVSRSTVREAVRSLQIAGILRSRPGSGTFVSDRALMILESRALPAVMTEPGAMGELAQARYVLEPELAFFAAQQAQSGDIEALMDTARRMQRTKDRSELMRLGYRFHMRLAETARNGVLLALYRSVDSGLQCMRVMDFVTLDVYLTGAAEHMRIAEAVAAHDAERARSEMQRHIRKSYASFFDGNGEGRA